MNWPQQIFSGLSPLRGMDRCMYASIQRRLAFFTAKTGRFISYDNDIMILKYALSLCEPVVGLALPVFTCLATRELIERSNSFDS